MEPAAELPLRRGVRDFAARWGAAYAARVTAISVAALAGRLLFLGYQPLWRDEAFTAVVVQRPWGSMLDTVRADSAPPLLYLVDHLVAAVSASTWSLRLVPAVAGAAAVPLAASLARRIGGDRAGIAAAAFAALAPALVLSARDARMYALATTLVLASTLLLLRALERPTVARWAAYAGVTMFALYTDYFSALAVVAQLVAAAVVLRTLPRRMLPALLAAAAAALPLVPWLIVARTQFMHAAEFWVPPLSPTWVGGALVQFFTGPPVNDWVPGKPVLLGVQALAVAAGLGALAGIAVGWRRFTREGRRTLAFCAVCALGALLLLIALSVWRPLLTGSYASVLWGPLFPLAGAGLAALGHRTLIAGSLAVTAAASVALSAATTHPDTRGALSLLREQAGMSDVVDAHPSQYLLLLYYGDSETVARTHLLSSHVAWFWGTAAYPPGAVIASVPPQVVANHGRIFFIAQPDETPENLPSGYHAVARACATGSCVTTYAPGA